MNRKVVLCFAVAVLIVLIGLIVGIRAGCVPEPIEMLVGQDPTPRTGYTGRWSPQWIYADQMETNDLPPAQDVLRDHKERVERDGCPSTARIYIAKLNGEYQGPVTVRHYRAETPLGNPRYTSAEFVYSDPVDGEYVVRWKMRGHHDPSFLEFGSEVRTALLHPTGHTGDGSTPLLMLLGVEGVGPNPHAF